MRAMLMSTVGLVALAISSGVGLAADLAVEPDTAPAAAAFDWSGFYAGIALGGGQINSDYDDDVGGYSFSQGGLTALLTAGFNIQDGSLVYGIEGDIGVLRGSGDVDYDYGIWSDGQLDYTAIGTLRGRIGYATENVLLYGTAGLALANIDFALDDWSASGTRYGAVVGVGAELAVTDQISLKAEGRYYAFAEADADYYGYTHTSNAAVALVGANFHF